MSITTINFKFDPHKEIIMKLCNRNNFHTNDVYIELYRDLPGEMKNLCIAKQSKIYFDALFLGLESYGYFTTIDVSGKKKVIGFIIYNITLCENKSNLLFILIDKQFQKKGFGTKLVNKYIEDIHEKKLFYGTVKVENEEASIFYKKSGFDKHSDFIESEKGRYELLHYIPINSFNALKIVKKLSLFMDS
jgi:ribosomal protein S18 acetylase RimI-like enzyme